MKVHGEGEYGPALSALRQQIADLSDWMLANGIPPVTIANLYGDLAAAVLAERVRAYRYQQAVNGKR